MTMETIEVPDDVRDTCTHLTIAGFQSWVVGGAVRDALMGKEPHDWDIATNATPEQVQKIFARTFPTGIAHGTVTVRTSRGNQYEVTTFRGDGSYSDGRRPDKVSFLNTIEEDLARRDFTVNAIAYDPSNEKFADPFKGLDDIQNGILRAVGNPVARFSEDGLRCLRAARFSATLGFTIHPDTLAAIPLALSSYRAVSVERIREEWLKTMLAPKPSTAFQVMLDYGMMNHIAPEFMTMAGCKQNRYHEHDVWGHTMAVMDSLPANDPILRITGLMHDVAKPKTKCFCEERQDYTFHDHDELGAEMTHEMFNRLRFSVEERTRVCHLVRHHILHYTPEWQDKAVRRWISRVTPDHIDSLFTLAMADIAGKGNAKTHMDVQVLHEFRERIRTLEESVPTPTGIRTLVINGSTLMKELGIPQGPQLGKILKALLEEVTDDPELNTEAILLEKAAALHNLQS